MSGQTNAGMGAPATDAGQGAKTITPGDDGIERYPGLFVTFEGIDGTGKTTQITRLADLWRGRAREVVTTFEPGKTKLGTTIRRLLLSADSGITLLPRAEALLYAADRAEDVDEIIRPALRRGAIVLADRYIDSSLAYQGAGRELTVDQIDWLSAWATQGLWPDRTYLLDLDPVIAYRRVTLARGEKPDRMEELSQDFRARTRDEFLRLARQDPSRYRVLDATLPVEELTKNIDDDLSRLVEAKTAQGASSQGGAR